MPFPAGIGDDRLQTRCIRQLRRDKVRFPGGAVKVGDQGVRGSLAVYTKDAELEFVVAKNRIGRQLSVVVAVS